MHAGQGPGLSNRRLGQKLGAETHTLTSQQIPGGLTGTTTAADAETKCFAGPGNSNVAAGNTWSQDAGNQSGTYNTNTANGAMQAGTVRVPALTVNCGGGGQSHNNMHPVQVINFIIALVGTYPSRS